MALHGREDPPGALRPTIPRPFGPRRGQITGGTTFDKLRTVPFDKLRTLLFGELRTDLRYTKARCPSASSRRTFVTNGAAAAAAEGSPGRETGGREPPAQVGSPGGAIARRSCATAVGSLARPSRLRASSLAALRLAPARPAAGRASQGAPAVACKGHLDHPAAHGNLLDDVPFKAKQRTNAVLIHGSTFCRSMSRENPLHKQRLSVSSSIQFTSRIEEGPEIGCVSPDMHRTLVLPSRLNRPDLPHIVLDTYYAIH